MAYAVFIIYRVIPFLMVEIPILCLHHSLPIFFPGMILNHADCIRIIWKCTRDFFFLTKLWALLTETLCLQLLPTLSDFFLSRKLFYDGEDEHDTSVFHCANC